MSFATCVQRYLEKKVITQEKAKEAIDLFGSKVQQYRDAGLTPHQAEVKAASESYKELDFAAIERKRKKLIQAKVIHEIKRDMDKYRDIKGEKNTAKAAEAIFVQDDLAPYSNLEYSMTATRGMLFGRMEEFLSKYRRNLVGRVRNKANMTNFVREAFGEDTGDEAAKEFAAAWYHSHEYARKRANAAGMNIAKHENYGLPQTHNTLKLRNSTTSEWIDYVSERLDFANMLDHKTGLPFKETSLNTEVVLSDTYQTITSEGFSKMNPNVAYKSSLGNRRADHRFLKFKDAKSWLEYHKDYGVGTIFDAAVGHLSAMARDIAVLERLGPNPNATIAFLKNQIMKDAQKVTGPGYAKAKNQAKRSQAFIQKSYNVMTGNFTGPTDTTFANVFAGTRQILVAAQLGAATLPAITDLNFQRMARHFNGMKEVTILNDQLKQLMLLGANDRRKQAIRMMIGAEEWSTMAAAQQRLVGEIGGPEITRRTADFVMRASVLSPWTYAGRRSFAMEFFGTIADLSKSNYAKVEKQNPRFFRTLQRYGIDKESWDIIRKTNLVEYKGVKFFDPGELQARTDLPTSLSTKLTTRVLTMMHQEAQRAVPSVDVRGRVALQGDEGGGTVLSEIGNSFSMYKSFSVTVFNTHLMRGIKMKNKTQKTSYLLDLIISTTLMGALAIQLKEIHKGRDPLPMTDATFWGKAMLQGGGLPILGDFIGSATNRFGDGFATTIAGPVAGLASKIWDLTGQNLIELAQGKDTNFQKELIKFTHRYTPGANLWYLRLVIERMLVDRLLEWSDEDFDDDIRKIERRAEKQGTEYFWPPGEPEPERMPDYGNILEKRD